MAESLKPGTLYVVATPIGNMSDLSARARLCLASADVVACEDTRKTGALLARAGIKRQGRLFSYRDANEARQAPGLVAKLGEGQSVVLVSDAGTPAISDPGFRLVRLAAQSGLEVVAVPGPSALTALLSVCGLATDRFSFEGFLAPSGSKRHRAIEDMKGAGRTYILYESPRRIVRLLGELCELLDDPEVAVGRELTKMHEQVLRGRASEVAARLDNPRGEFAVAVYCEGHEQTLGGQVLEAEVERLLDQGLSVRDVAARLKPRGAPRREVYAAARALGRR